MENERWVCVHKTSGLNNARIIEGRIRTEGIPTKLKYDIAGTIYGITIDGLGEVQILVPESYRQVVKKILTEKFDEKDISWEE